MFSPHENEPKDSDIKIPLAIISTSQCVCLSTGSHIYWWYWVYIIPERIGPDNKIHWTASLTTLHLSPFCLYILLLIIIYFLPWGSGPDGPRKKIQWIASPTTQPVHPSSRPRTNQEPRTVLNALNQKGPEPFPAQRAALSLIIVAGIVPSYGQGTRQSHFRNDPMKYDLKEAIIFVFQTITYWWSMRNLSNCDIQCKLGHIGILFNIYFI